MIGAALPTEQAAAPFAVMRDLKKDFANGLVALRAVNLAIGQGEFLSLVGPSGCGKSTILRMLAGLASPSSGSIEFPGEAQGGLDRKLGIVFQEATLMPWISVLSVGRIG
jgi:NitT/TauT family transport system ATP-binding protein